MSDEMIIVGRYTGMASVTEFIKPTPTTEEPQNESNGPKELPQSEKVEEAKEDGQPNGSSQEDSSTPADEQGQKARPADELEPSQAAQEHGYRSRRLRN